MDLLRTWSSSTACCIHFDSIITVPLPHEQVVADLALSGHVSCVIFFVFFCLHSSHFLCFPKAFISFLLPISSTPIQQAPSLWVHLKCGWSATIQIKLPILPSFPVDVIFTRRPKEVCTCALSLCQCCDLLQNLLMWNLCLEFFPGLVDFQLHQHHLQLRWWLISRTIRWTLIVSYCCIVH